MAEIPTVMLWSGKGRRIRVNEQDAGGYLEAGWLKEPPTGPTVEILTPSLSQGESKAASAGENETSGAGLSHKRRPNDHNKRK